MNLNIDELFSPNQEVSFSAIPGVNPKVLVCDDFYKNPEQIASLAHSLDYTLDWGEAEHKLYPGERAYVSLGAGEIEGLLLNIYFSNEPSFSKLLRLGRKQPLTFTRMNDSTIALANPRQRVPHIDSDCELVALVYLGTTEAAQESETIFYRHRSSGIHYLPRLFTSAIAGLAKDFGMGLLTAANYNELVKSLMFSGTGGEEIDKYLTGISEETDEWEIIGRVKAQFNRCIIFPAKIFHSPVYRASSPPPSPACRLTQNFFFNAK